MQPLPFHVVLSLLTSACVLIFSGIALAGAAFARGPGSIVLFAAIFVLAAVGAPLLIARQIGRVLRERDAPAERADPEASPFPVELTLPEPSSAPDDEEALRRSRKAQAVDRLRDGIAHDLNNRLMVISANIDSVARQVKDQPALQRKLLSALVAAEQAGKLIAKSTDFARQTEPHVQYIDLAESVGSVAALMGRSLLRDTVELHVSLDEDLWPVEADPDDVETAIVTLSAHVRDALTQGGTITLEARNVQLRPGSLANGTLQGDFVQLAIRSSGLGEDHPHGPDGLFEQSFSLENLDLSSWLDLSDSLRFLRRLGGASEVRRSGSETAILLYLPRADAAIPMPSGLAGEDDGLGMEAPDHAEILVVDDEVEVALALQAMLEEFGYVTRIATDAAQAMKSLSARRPGLVLADVAMPGTMNGAMLAREVRSILPGLPVILITGNPVMADGDNEFPLLQKPIVSRDLHAAIQRHLTQPDRSTVVPLFPHASRRLG